MIEIPDHVPDDLLIAYGSDARRRVRRTRPLRVRTLQTVRSARARACDPRAWLAAIAYVGAAMFLVAIGAAVSFAVARDPLLTVAATLPVIGITCLALAASLLNRDERARAQADW